MLKKIGLGSLIAMGLSGCVIVADGEDYYSASKAGASDRAVGSYQVSFAAPTKSQKSHKSFEATVEDLRAAIESRGLTIFATIDHAAGASSVGSDLAPTILIIFGNPKAGTALMQVNPEVGIALPLKALVWQSSDGSVMVSVTNVHGLSQQFALGDSEPVIKKIDGALAAILEEATAPSSS